MKKEFWDTRTYTPPRVGHQDVLFDDAVKKSYLARNSESELDRIKLVFRKGIVVHTVNVPKHLIEYMVK